jgi:hypothetical protein
MTNKIKPAQESDQLTHSPTLRFFSRRPNDCQYLRQNFHGYFPHCSSGRYLCVDFESAEEVFNPTEKVNENALLEVNVFSRLEILHIKMGCTTLNVKREGA